MTTTLIRGGIVVNADCSERADVLVRNRKIIAVGVGFTGDTTIGAGRLTKEEFVNVTSTNIAKILNMYPRKSVPRTVISRGNVALEQGDMRAKAGDGDFLARKPNTPVHVANAIWKGVSAPRGVERIEVVP